MKRETMGAKCLPPDPRTIRVEVAGGSRSYYDGTQRVTTVALSVKRRHNRKLLIPPPGEHSATTGGGIDLPMIRMLGKAFYWKRQIEQGHYATATELARTLKLEPGWVAEVLRLTLLAPDIIEAIFDGRQPRQLDLHALRGRAALLPRDWAEQRRLLGFPERPV
ncbi:hypothetical protein LGM90_26560 [Burkholderia sp. AU28942]|uniref:hypothetical protein n=1 Tax=Burkholderia TaxID=32008 RepID=UPI000AA8B4DB|nr:MULTISPECIES: hypothetical protein [Burkholderia]MCA8312078.1 hypothetical protein [Burkholderia sp. AU28942]